MPKVSPKPAQPSAVKPAVKPSPSPATTKPSRWEGLPPMVKELEDMHPGNTVRSRLHYCWQMLLFHRLIDDNEATRIQKDLEERIAYEAAKTKT